MQLSNSSCKHIGVKTPLARCSYHNLLFHSSILKSESPLQKFCMLLWSVIGFILPFLLWSFLLFFFHLDSLLSSPFLLWVGALFNFFSHFLFFSLLWSDFNRFLKFSTSLFSCAPCMCRSICFLWPDWNKAEYTSLTVGKQFIYLSAWHDPFLWKADCL